MMIKTQFSVNENPRSLLFNQHLKVQYIHKNAKAGIYFP